MNNAFTIKEALSFGWRKFRENAWFYVAVTLAFGVISAFLDKIDGTKDTLTVVGVLNIFVSLYAMYVFIRLGLIALENRKAEWKDVFTVEWKVFGLYIVGNILYTLAYGIGLVLLIVPGLIAIIRFGFFGFALVEGKIGPVHSLKKSAAMTKGYFWKLLGFSVVLALINIAGALAVGIGLLVTAPVTLLATVYVYEKLRSAPVTIASAPVESAAQTDKK